MQLIVSIILFFLSELIKLRVSQLKLTAFLPCRDKPLNLNETKSKYTISDVLFSSQECYASFSLWTYVLIGVAGIFWIVRAITVFFHILHNYDIRCFMKVALKIDDSELENYTWHEVQRRIRSAQSEIQLCVHKDNLSELDIYHRILR